MPGLDERIRTYRERRTAELFARSDPGFSPVEPWPTPEPPAGWSPRRETYRERRGAELFAPGISSGVSAYYQRSPWEQFNANFAAFEGRNITPTEKQFIWRLSRGETIGPEDLRQNETILKYFYEGKVPEELEPSPISTEASEENVGLAVAADPWVRNVSEPVRRALNMFAQPLAQLQANVMNPQRRGIAGFVKGVGEAGTGAWLGETEEEQQRGTAALGLVSPSSAAIAPYIYDPLSIAIAAKAGGTALKFALKDLAEAGGTAAGLAANAAAKGVELPGKVYTELAALGERGAIGPGGRGARKFKIPGAAPEGEAIPKAGFVRAKKPLPPPAHSAAEVKAQAEARAMEEAERGVPKVSEVSPRPGGAGPPLPGKWMTPSEAAAELRTRLQTELKSEVPPAEMRRAYEWYQASTEPEASAREAAVGMTRAEMARTPLPPAVARAQGKAQAERATAARAALWKAGPEESVIPETAGVPVPKAPPIEKGLSEIGVGPVPRVVRPGPRGVADIQFDEGRKLLDADFATQQKAYKARVDAEAPAAASVAIAGNDSSILTRKVTWLNKLGEETSDVFRNRDELLQAKIADPRRGHDAYWLEQHLDARDSMSISEAALEVNEKLADPKIWEKVERVVGRRAASFLTDMGRRLPFVGGKFGVARGRMPQIFDVVEGIKEVGLDGEPVFGTRIFVKNATGEQVPINWRQTPVAARTAFEALTPHEQGVAKWAVQRLDELKSLDNIEGGLEGYMRHYHPRRSSAFASWTGERLRDRLPGFLRFRTEAPGFIKNFDVAMKGRLAESARAKAKADFLPKYVEAITDPIEGGVLKEGWVEIKAGKSIPESAVGRQIPAKFHDDFLRHVEPLREVSEWAKLFRKGGGYWTANALLSPFMTPLRNLYSNVLQGVPLILDDLQVALATGNPKFFAQRMAGFVQSLLPRNLDLIPREFFGAKSFFAGQVSGEVRGAYKTTVDTLLYPITAIDGWAKRSIALGSLAQKGVNVRRLTPMRLADDMALFRIGREQADLYALNYSNRPQALEWLNRSPVGGLVAPFLSYPYGLARIMSRYMSAFIPGVPMTRAERLKRMITFTTIMGAVSAIRGREHATGNYIEGMDPRRLDVTGRTFAGKTAKGQEAFIRTKDQPWFNLYELGETGADLLRGRGLGPLVEFAREYITEGPLLNGVLLAAGYSTKYDKNKAIGARAGAIAKTFVPGFRITEGIRRLGQEEDRRAETFWDEFSRAIPGTATKGTIRRDRTTGAPYVFDGSLETLKFFAGINLKYVDPAEWTMEKGRIITAAINKLNAAQNEEQWLNARRELDEIAPEVAEKMFEGIAGNNAAILPEKAEDIKASNRAPAAPPAENEELRTRIYRYQRKRELQNADGR